MVIETRLLRSVYTVNAIPPLPLVCQLFLHHNRASPVPTKITLVGPMLSHDIADLRGERHLYSSLRLPLSRPHLDG